MFRRAFRGPNIESRRSAQWPGPNRAAAPWWLVIVRSPFSFGAEPFATRPGRDELDNRVIHGQLNVAVIRLSKMAVGPSAESGCDTNGRTCSDVPS